MHKMPSNLFKQLAEAILKSFAFADPMVLTFEYQNIIYLDQMFCTSMFT